MRRPPSRPGSAGHASLPPSLPPSLPAAPRRPPRTEFEYTRGGALQYLAAWDVHRAKVFGRCEPTTGIEPFGRLVAQVMTTEPYHSARRVFWVGRQRQQPPRPGRRPPASGRLAHPAPSPPAHPRLLAQPGRDLLLRHPAQTPHPNDFGNLAEVQAGLLAFQDHYQQITTPFEWKFTKSDLDLLLKRIDSHEPAPALAA